MNQRPRYKWGGDPNDPNQKPRTAKFLRESLLEFPDPSAIPQPDDRTPKQKIIVDTLTARHKEQRKRLFNTHVEKYHTFQSDISLALDPSSPYPPHPAHENDLPKDALRVMSSLEAIQALDELPADRRSVLMCISQLRDMEKDEKELTRGELAMEVARQEMELRRECLNEMLDLGCWQVEERRLYWESIARAGGGTGMVTRPGSVGGGVQMGGGRGMGR